ncbi:hypothetical protein [Paractinoplanes durhamensis]|nr:hypothetical protein [Actinoplanes durhamensis]
MRMFRTGLALLAAAVVGLALVPGPATASPTASPSPSSTPITIPAGAVSWIPATCATGSIDPVTVDQSHYLLMTHMTICSTYYAPLRYALAVFRPGRTASVVGRNQLLAYAPAGPSDRMADVRVTASETVFGLCIMRDLSTRTACVRVDIAADGTAVSAPIAPDDPLVAQPVTYTDVDIFPPDNYCATCVAFP